MLSFDLGRITSFSPASSPSGGVWTLRIDATHAFVFYALWAGGDAVKYRVATTQEDNIITFGSEQSIDMGSVDTAGEVRAYWVGENKLILFAVTMDDGPSVWPRYLRAVAGTVSGTTITWGTPVSLGSYATNNNFLNDWGVVINPDLDDRFAVLVCDVSQYHVVVSQTFGSLSGTAISVSQARSAFIEDEKYSRFYCASYIGHGLFAQLRRETITANQTLVTRLGYGAFGSNILCSVMPHGPTMDESFMPSYQPLSGRLVQLTEGLGLLVECIAVGSATVSYIRATTVNSTPSYSLGSRAQLAGHATISEAIIPLTSDRWAVVYKHGANSKAAIAIGSVSGTTVTEWGISDISGTIPSAADPYEAMLVHGCLLTGNDVLVVWRESSTVKAIVVRCTSAPTSPTGLLCDGSSNPNHIGATPLLTGVFNSDETTMAATHARVQVATDDGFQNVIWDSGVTALASPVSKGSSGGLIYDGADLEEGRKYWYRICFRDEWGKDGAWSSETAYFVRDLGVATGLVVTGFAKDAITCQCDPKDNEDVIYVWVQYVNENWQIKHAGAAPEWTFVDLEEATEYQLGVYVQTTDHGAAERVSLSQYTGREVIVTSIRDHHQQVIQGAAVVVLSEAELLAIEATADGEALPELGIARVNKSDENGQCTVIVPGNQGRALALFVPQSVEVGGDIRVHIET